MSNQSNTKTFSNIPCTMSVEIGSATLTLNEISNIAVSECYELNRLAGEPVLVKINGHMVAEAEIVILNERYGVRIIKVIDSNGDENE